MAAADIQVALQDVRLYAQPLDPAAVAALYQTGISLTTQPDAAQTA
jgi:hypothetical protein